MRKTSLYLSDQESESLRRLSAATGKPQAQIVREAIAEYARQNPPKQTFRSSGAGRSGKKKGVAQGDLDELLQDILHDHAQDERRWRSS